MTQSTPSTTSVELLAPAGDWDCARAAVENGADAIYFGLEAGFNARARAKNFHLDDLPKLMQMLHRQAVKGYVTLNTLVFTAELPSLEANVRKLAAAGVDAVLVQDIGVARLIHAICPDLVLHASTQMTLTCADAIEMARELNIQRAVLARELSLAEIRDISSKTNFPIECFVHGALCVAYSGQCLTSESLGGRSANRGQCAQACRLPYQIYKDGQLVELGDQAYLLSPQDLAAHDLVKDLIDAGVCSLKIEGRLKTPEYVANVCQHYRLAIDEALQGRRRKLSREESRELELSFSRGFSPGWLEGCDHKRLVPGLSSAKRGVFIGSVEEVGRDSISVSLSEPLATGDGIVLEGDRFAGKEIGGRVYELFQSGKSRPSVEAGTTLIKMQHGVLESANIPVGTRVFKTDDPKLTRRLRRSFHAEKTSRSMPVDIHVHVVVGQPLVATATTLPTGPVTIALDHVPEEARKHSLSLDVLGEQLSRLGGTSLELGQLTATLDGNPMLPLSILGKLRREIVLRVQAALLPKELECAADGVVGRMLSSVQSESKAEAGSSSILRVLCRSLAQLEVVLDSGVRDVIVEFHDIRQYRDACQLARRSGARIELATLRIHKPGEDGLFLALKKQDADGWLVRSLAAIRFCRTHGIPMAADFSLNVTNPLAAEQLKRWGVHRLTPSYDLNRDQLLELAEHTPSDWMEIVVHQHMPMFHMEHCVFCSVLSPGKNKSDCGRPCDRHDVKMTDRVSAEHVLHADIGCRNTLYNGVAQSGAEAVEPLQALGVRNFRVELLRDAEAETITNLIGLYRRLLDGQANGAEVWRALKADNRIGVTRGTLEAARNPLAIL